MSGRVVRDGDRDHESEQRRRDGLRGLRGLGDSSKDLEDPTSPKWSVTTTVDSHRQYTRNMPVERFAQETFLRWITRQKIASVITTSSTRSSHSRLGVENQISRNKDLTSFDGLNKPTARLTLYPLRLGEPRTVRACDL